MIKKIGKQNIILLGCILAVACLNQPLLEPGLQRTIRGLFVSFAYIAIVIYWGISVLECVKEKQTRRILFSVVGMLLFWLLLRACKYEIWDDKLDIALWYLFYVPQTLLPLMVFHMTLYIEGSKKPGKERILYIPAVLIMVGILTNNVHQLAFRFKDGISSKSGAYSYGILYYISLVWMIVFMLSAIINATRKSRILHRKKVFAILMIWIFIPILYLLYYQFGPFFLRTYFFNFPEGCCFIYIIFLEICIQSGMLLSNRQHEEIFENSSIRAEITDMEGHAINKSLLWEETSKTEKEAAKNSPIVVKDSYELRANKIDGGYVYWLSDIKELLEINRNLQEFGEELAEENHILKAELSAKARKTALEEQNQIYDSVNTALGTKREQILSLLNEKEQIYKALVLAAYMKRKGNLVILSKQASKADIRELGLCINESFSYLGLKGCLCSCTISGNGMVSTDILISFYDTFEEIVEQVFEKMEAFLCYIKCEKSGISMRCQIECDEDFTVDLEGITLQQQDNTFYLDLKAEEVEYE